VSIRPLAMPNERVIALLHPHTLANFISCALGFLKEALLSNHPITCSVRQKADTPASSEKSTR